MITGLNIFPRRVEGLALRDEKVVFRVQLLEFGVERSRVKGVTN